MIISSLTRQTEAKAQKAADPALIDWPKLVQRSGESLGENHCFSK